MFMVGAWGEDDGKRKGRYEICSQIEKIIEAMTPQLWFEPVKDRYIASYQQLLREAYGATRRRVWNESFVVAFVQRLFSTQEGGWMARAGGRCVINREAAARLADALNTFDRSNEALWNLVTIVSELVNDSMIGGSKFLHFCLPGLYAITDQYLRLVSATPPRTPRCDAARREAEYYRTYMAALNMVKREHAKQAMRWAKKVFGYRVTRTRAIEAFVFYHVREFDNGRLSALEPIMDRAPRHASKMTRRRFYSCIKTSPAVS
ncbi:hypothetical protein [Burkholderia cenocepacia]|uniref:hypothetical protein n=1 Tax=Burkholderia cenocepacia TaxID=95486 RepID=UPI000F579611|nr:hypothetical protein [Burkholderia cenocepacia]MBR8159511.1 hypothetical protein [Burkholderia cenocepacia]MBR8305675.1 hypothetical protein [Burkholderia cenocepacia]MCA7921476.1 hypothetical protein [Burkholderia cenocepacia]MEC4771478.1 hypothetical protein [Burkholderia cenocepacia]RQU05238.1 hypothetical protein DF157_35105 [Burkholderia cenocepacia]